jgi:hypothetical protein
MPPLNDPKEVREWDHLASLWGISERQLRLHNIERQRQMLTDMDKLANLVTSLRDQMSHGAVPETTNVANQAEEIEKMAHKVGQGMKK